MSQRRCGWRPEDPLERAASIVVAVGRFAAVLPGYRDDVNQFVTDGRSTLESSAVWRVGTLHNEPSTVRFESLASGGDDA